MACFLFFSYLPVTAAPAAEYRLGAGDVLNIDVWGVDALQVKEFIVRPDGKIDYPLVGELVVDGLTTAEFKKELTVGLNEYIRDPKVTVNVIKYHTTRVYVLGEVQKPGLYELEKAHNLLDAIGAAGGYTKDAAKKKIYVARKDKPKELIKANLLQLLQKADFSQNLMLEEGDVVYLSSNNRVDYVRDILPLLTGAYYITHYDDK